MATEARLQKLGARPIDRVISSNIEAKIADLLISESISDGDELLIKLSDGKPIAVRKTQALLY